MAKRIVELFVALQLCLVLFTIQIYCIESTRQQQIKYVIFDTDMGADDAWALQMLLTAEKEFQNVKVLGITTVSGNTDVIDVIKNTYRILDDLNRTDVSFFDFFIIFSFSKFEKNKTKKILLDSNLQRSIRGHHPIECKK